MMYRYLFPVVLSMLSCFASVQAQHTLSIAAEDTVFLDATDARGQLQWQLSLDQVNWDDIPGRTYDTIKFVPDQFPSYLRLVIIEGNCAPHYTDVVEVLEAVVTPQVPTVTTVKPYSIASASAVAGGSISNTGGKPITSRGIVYSTAPNPTVESAIVVSNGTGGGSYSSLLIGLSSSTTYYVRAFATNEIGTGYGEEYAFTTQADKVYYIGEEGPAGGTVYYDKGFYSDGWRYLELAPAGWAGATDPWVDLEWGCYEIFVGGTSTDIGTGKENTDLILAKGCADADTPVQLAANATINGYDDWFLPSRDELSAIYHNLFNLGPNFHYTYGLLALTYTTSSELDAKSTWGVAFGDGSNTQNLKILATIAVRPVRRF